MLSLPFFFFNDTATTEIYTLSLHDALPIFRKSRRSSYFRRKESCERPTSGIATSRGGSDRKSTRLNSSHMSISYAVFCLKKKKNEARCHNTAATSTSSVQLEHQLVRAQ